jgi:hypothetical protein
MLSPQLSAAIATVLLAATPLTVALVITSQSELTPQQRVDEAFLALQERPQWGSSASVTRGAFISAVDQRQARIVRRRLIRRILRTDAAYVH